MKSREKFILIAAAILAVILCFNGNLSAYSGGTGDMNDPYQIATPEDLNDIGNHAEDFGKYFKLTADINMAAYTGTQFPVIGSSWPAIFSGLFDGDGHIIRNLTINRPSENNISLFGSAAGAQIRNLALEDVNITGHNQVGGLVGVGGSLTITDCHVTGTVSGAENVGGLVGYTNIGPITSCSFTGTVTGSNDCIGGLIGFIDWSGGPIVSCSAEATVSGPKHIGGLIGYAYTEVTITSCHSDGTISGSNFCVGGLIGTNHSTITSCYSTAEVSGSGDCVEVGGLVGSNWGTINNCYATGTVSGPSAVGGFAGDNWGAITASFSAGPVSGLNNVGGLAGYYEGAGGTFDNCFWDINTSGQPTSTGGMGKTTAEMKTLSTFTSAGWDFSWTDGNTAVWALWIEGQSYPALAWQPATFGGGSGTPADPWQIATAQQLLYLANNSAYYSDSFILTADINLTGLTFTQAPIAPNTDNIDEYWVFQGTQFTGIFDGNGHTISNLTITAEQCYVGLFGYIGSSGQIRNLGVEDVNITGYEYAGGLAGGNAGTLTDCYATGSVAGSGCVGGLAGGNHSGTLTNCYATSSVTGTNAEGGGVGGLVGYNEYGTITSCYATGSARSYAGVGGLVGSNGDWSFGGTITSCYATGSVSGIGYVGGLVGMNGGGSLTSCYAVGSVTGRGEYNWYIGGLVGMNGGSLTSCYSTGSVSGYSDVGGLVGWNNGGALTACFWDINASGTTDGVGSEDPDPNGGTGKTTAEMKTLSTFTSEGWDFSYTDGDPADWFIQVDEYPILTWQISPADLYTDGKNNFKDWAIFAKYWLRKDCAIYNDYCEWADMNFDGHVDINDLGDFITYWLEEGIY